MTCHRTLGLIIFILLLVRCGDGRFRGSAGPVGSSRLDSRDGPASSKGENPDGQKERDADETLKQPDVAIAILSRAAECLIRRADKYNFALVFDTSGSTGTTDPTNVRKTAALNFVSRISKAVAAAPKLDIEVASIGFNKVATAGEHGWIRLDSATGPTNVAADITSILQNNAGSTHFNEAIGLGQSLLQKQGAEVGKKRERNFLIIMSDGKANGSVSQTADLLSLLSPLIQKSGAAVYGIAAGKNLNSSGKQLMQALSLPAVGIVATDHVGRYYEAPDDKAVSKAWDDLYLSMTSCDDVKRSSGKAIP